MKSTLMTRAASLLITTILVAAPAWAQQSTAASGTSPDTPHTPPVTSSQSATPPASSAQNNNAPSGTLHKAVPNHSRNAVARQPGETMQSLVERRIADLHSKLHITNDQEQQWNQFAQTMRDNAKDTDTAYQQRAEKISSMSAVENMQSFAQIEQQRSQDMQKLVPAFQTLYASLTDQQKKTADQLFRNYAASARSHRQAAATK
jgi:periplasmic protein CpxP/Spy